MWEDIKGAKITHNKSRKNVKDAINKQYQEKNDLKKA